MKIDSSLFYHWNVIDLVIGLLIFYSWGRSWSNNLQTPKWIALTFLVIGVLASSAFMMGIYGYHYEVIEQHEVWPEGQWENDFEPTDEERYTYGFCVC